MQVVFLIGNGFDINLGMETKYSDFCKYYQDIETDSAILKSLKEDIKKGINTWADLELRFGEYTENLKSLAEFDEVYDDLIDNLGDYLESVEIKTDLNLVSKDDLYQYFGLPELSLPPSDFNELKSYINKWNANVNEVNIITFNYTRTIERLFGDSFKGTVLGKNIGNHPIVLKDIYHIHGLCDDRMIIGVNDISQIKNSTFHNDRNITNALIKANNNRVQKHTIDQICQQKISSANLICIFGSSIGDTDNFWWEAIGQKLLNEPNCRLIIFTKGEEIKKRLSYKKDRVENAIKELFLNKTKLKKDNMDIVAEKIYVTANSKIFNQLVPGF